MPLATLKSVSAPFALGPLSMMHAYVQGACSALALVGEGELALADAVSELDAREGHRGGREGFQPEHRSRALLDRAVILLDDGIEVAAGSHRHVLPARIFLPEQAQAEMGGGISVEIDLLVPERSGDFHRLSKEFLMVRSSRRREWTDLPLRSTAR